MDYKIIQNGEVINIIVADEAFCKAYCEKHGYTYALMLEPEPEIAEPTELEQLRADVDYIAMETGVEL